ncbi:isochorismatase family protein [Fulvivirgaceae bacterium PWU5]|uniref:Isochorismatase family protein n=1 Tax=Dawidia cretensis TaxID=2782350 RepID=A0AAP2GMP6_9BACT|nr:isochorismatase family protein [Dawidia cretensis]MBT1706646.1 isochorismatase family protein [Dawidia cretensis]
MGEKALLIIDMQKGAYMEAPCFDAEGVLMRINQLGEIFRQAGWPVFLIQHNGTKTNEFIPHTPAWEFLDELVVSPTDIVMSKQAHDAFYETTLEEELTRRGVRELYITGSATDFCVESTVQSALSKDYQIVVVKDGHTMSDRPHLSAKAIIEHYNWIWELLIPTRGCITVQPFEVLKASLSQ